jgi:hypothetical protein
MVIVITEDTINRHRKGEMVPAGRDYVTRSNEFHLYEATAQSRDCLVKLIIPRNPMWYYVRFGPDKDGFHENWMRPTMAGPEYSVNHQHDLGQDRR